jgi:NADPH-dependent curcumin reductase CurA
MVDAGTTRLETVPVPEPGPGEAVARVRYLSIDPTIRTWMDDAPGYLPPIEIDAVVRSGGIGEVVASNSERYAVGDTVFGMLGWQDHAVIDEGESTAQVIPPGVEPTAALSVFGVTGMTAYFGLLDIGKPQPGDTVVVSGAAGATGSIVGQIARIKDAGKVVGIAGGPEKCAWIVDELGFDAAIDYKNDDVRKKLREHAPDGIDVYFDNVGGEILDHALAQLRRKARVVICGAISQYNAAAFTGPKNYMSLLVNSARMEGFVIFHFAARYPEAAMALAKWHLEGKLKAKEDIAEGIDQFPEALCRLFRGENFGKLILKI